MATLGLIEYEDASPEVRAVYDDIMANQKNCPGEQFLEDNFWKSIAHDPGHSKAYRESIEQIADNGTGRRSMHSQRN
jgi:hypothetical protein